MTDDTDYSSDLFVHESENEKEPKPENEMTKEPEKGPEPKSEPEAEPEPPPKKKSVVRNRSSWLVGVFCVSLVACLYVYLPLKYENSDLQKRLSSDEELIHDLEERLLYLELEHSSSKDSGIPTGHSGAYHGGAIYDEIRNQIVSVSRESNNCRDVYVTKLLHADHGITEEPKKNKILFDTYFRIPVYDGKRYAYFTEATIDGGKGKRFGRLDLSTFKFEELDSIPERPFRGFADAFAGCYHDGVVYYADKNSRLCGYDVGNMTWHQFDLSLPLAGEHQYGTLLSDPLDHNHLYLLGHTPNDFLYRIDLDAHSCTVLSALPQKGDEFHAVLFHFHRDSKHFVIVSCTRYGWYMYLSKTNSWKAIPRWKESPHDYVKNYVAYIHSTRSFYYHIHGDSTWQTVHL